ncbi:MAG: CvpA family protein [Bacteroidetes bacterium]|nr:CvpA family protein [Bacteroidota bacterium]MBI3482793.1 CvpA family protein [Bacteroidota bacterium]
MSKIDIVISLLLILGAYLGYKRGFLSELFFVVAMILGVLVGFKLMGWGMEYLHKQFNADTAFLPYLSFLIIFILVVVTVIFIGNRIKHLMDDTFLGRVDAIAGAVLGLVKYAFCASVLLWLAEKIELRFPDHWTQGSWLYPKTLGFAKSVSEFFARFLPFFKETFRRF